MNSPQQTVDQYALNFPKPIAFEPRPEEVSIKIRPDHKYNFTRKWFRLRNQTTFTTYLLPEFPPDKPCRAIQIGVFEGMDLVWQFQNTLANPNSRCLAIDPWLPTPKLDQSYMDGCHIRASANLFPYRKKLEMVRGKSQEVLRDYLSKPFSVANQHIPPGHYDYIVIDGDHDAEPVYQDAVLALQLVKVGGILLFDDVRNKHDFKDHVKHGLEKFTKEYGDQIELAWYHRYCNAFRRTK